MRVEFATIGGTRTRFFRAGEGRPVLLLHGVGMTADSWYLTIPALASDHAVFAPDLLDNGFTGAGDYAGGPPHPFMLRHLEDFLGHLGIGRFAVVGSSFGGLLATLLYFHMPQRVERLVIVSSGSSSQPPEALAVTYRNAYDNGRRVFLDPTVEVCRDRLGRIFADRGAIPEPMLLAQLTAYAWPGALAGYERRLKGMMDPEAIRPFRVDDRLDRIAVPTLAVWGRDDPRSDIARASAKLGQVPDIRIEVLDRCGHLPHLEQPDRFNAMLRSFLAGTTPRP